MEIREFRTTLKARDFDRTCQFYGAVLALPRLTSRDSDEGRSAVYQAGAAQIEVTGLARGKDESVGYHPPTAPMVLSLIVASAEVVYDELIFRDRNIPGGLRKDKSGNTVYETHDPDGVKILFVEE
ncbi:MAG: VOC family protein [Thermoanaerobaculia bacterium]